VRRELHENWTVTATAGEGTTRLGATAVPARVPGVVHVDLLAAGLIADPYLDENEAAAAWVGRTDWTYSTTFGWAQPDAGAGSGADGEAGTATRGALSTRVDLVAEGLDTVAQLRLNGTVLGSTRNMHRTYRFDVTELLVDGENELVVAFQAPMDAAEQAQAELGARPHVNAHPYNALRKNASSFGWDWGPDLPTSGIWRSIALDTVAGGRIAALRPLVDVAANGTGMLDVHADIERLDAAPLTLRVTVGGRRVEVVVPADGAPAASAAAAGEVAPARTVAVQARVEVPDVEPWWPRGYGPQALHEVSVELARGAVVLDVRTPRVGFRTVAVESEPDDHGTSFALRVNGSRVLVRGFNWIPDDAFLPRVDRARYERRLGQAVDANANLLRVWGGGIYESEDFYELCDEFGLLVWQDFPFSCAAYAEEDPLGSQVRAEAREAVTRLSAHPSLALWCGGNECLWGYADWGWKEPLAGRTWGLGLYIDVLPGIVAELDPTRPYVPGSPFSPAPAGHVLAAQDLAAQSRHPNDPAHGPMHIWDVWNTRDYTAYLDYTPRFVSEFGFQAPPTWSTLTRALHDDVLGPDSPGMLAHQKAEDGNGKLRRGLQGHLPEPVGFEDWHWATQLNQGRALVAGIEHFRALAPVCTGAVVWQLNDCWPVSSWSVVDGDERLKPSWYAVRRAFRDHLAVVRRSVDGGLEVSLVADGPGAWREDVAVTRVAFDGAVLATTTLRVDLASRASTVLPLPVELAVPGDPKRVLVVVHAAGARTFFWFGEDVDVQLPAPEVDVTAQRDGDGYVVRVSARTLVKDLALLVDRLDPDAEVDDMLLTLLPGEAAVLRIRTNRELPVAALAAAPVLRTANELTAPPAGPGAAG